ncbi:hypothetical protein JXJ21_19055 [candidate division KSB1 bacterium]|nr:hypothetical protein [candidate division KSB1 bacterium]
MKRCPALFFAITLIILSALICSEQNDKTRFTENETSALKVLAGVTQLFKQAAPRIWQGYDLSARTYLFYMPDKWALLVNSPSQVKGFQPYPKDFPDLGCPALYHPGKYDDLVGQLAFNFQVDTFQTIAIGVPEALLANFADPQVYLFGFVCHEAFHQFQYEAFGEIPWAREELYPILDERNSALAYIEMRLLMDALKSAYAGQRKQVEEQLEQFVAVRKYRWQTADAFVSKFEQGLEIREGTAQYVQIKSVVLFKDLPLDKLKDTAVLSLQDEFQTISMPDYLINDFQARITEGAISPDDMPRNRIYPVGSTLGLLMDYLNIDWKKKVQHDCPNFSFADLLVAQLGIESDQAAQLLSKAEKKYDIKKINETTEKLINDYRGGYEDELKSFDAQPGYRMEISFGYQSISRSRSSSCKRWTMRQGEICLCRHYNVYSLKNKDFSFTLTNNGLYEETDWQEKKKKIVFFTDEISGIALDDAAFSVDQIQKKPFDRIKIFGKNFEFSFAGDGEISVSDNLISVRF